MPFIAYFARLVLESRPAYSLPPVFLAALSASSLAPSHSTIWAGLGPNVSIAAMSRVIPSIWFIIASNASACPNFSWYASQLSASLNCKNLWSVWRFAMLLPCLAFGAEPSSPPVRIVSKTCPNTSRKALGLNALPVRPSIIRLASNKFRVKSIHGSLSAIRTLIWSWLCGSPQPSSLAICPPAALYFVRNQSAVSCQAPAISLAFKLPLFSPNASRTMSTKPALSRRLPNKVRRCCSSNSFTIACARPRNA